MGELPAQGLPGAEPTANLFHVDTPTGTQYGDRRDYLFGDHLGGASESVADGLE